MSWQSEAVSLTNAGFGPEEIAQEAARVREEMSGAGFGKDELDDFFGTKEPDMAPVKQLIEKNLAAARGSEGPELKVAQGFLESIDAGFQMSTAAMLNKFRKGESVRPDKILDENASAFYRIASKAATIAGDLPAMIAGGLGGSAVIGGLGASVGTIAPGVGNVIGGVVGTGLGAAGGANALPTAIRETLMQYYEKGEIRDFQDFWERASSVFIDTTKDYAIGVATMGAGQKLGKLVGASLPKVAAPLVPTATKIATVGGEIGTMVTLGAALEGEVPNSQDFMDATLLVGGLNVATKAPKKLREIYAKTGQRPHEVVQEAQTNPVVLQDLLVKGDEIPKVYQEMAKAQAPVEPVKTPEVSKESTPPAPAPETATDKILSRIGKAEEKEAAGYGVRDFYKDFVDKLDPINNAVKELGIKAEDLTADKDPYKLARMASDSKAKVKHFFEFGTLDYKTLENTGKSFNEIVEPHKAELGGFKAYLISKRALELNDRGIKTGFDLEAATEVVKGGGKFEKAAGEIVEFQNSMAAYLKDSGILSSKAFDAMVEMGQNYISFKRVMESGEAGGKPGAKNPIKKIKGSDLKIQDPFVSMIENGEAYIRLAESNRAKVAMVELAEKAGDGLLFERVPDKMRPIEVRSEEVTKAMRDQGILDPTDAHAEAFTIFRKADRPLADNEFEVFRHGKREVYKTDPLVAEAIKTLDGNSGAQNIVVKMARAITTVKRVGISLMPDFILRNFIRDQVSSGAFSKAGAVPFWDTVQAMGDIVSKNQNYQNWLKAGGANGAFLELGEKYMNQNIFKTMDETGVSARVWNVVRKPVEYLELAGSITEQATRLAEAKRVRGNEISGTKIFESGFASREITIDFQRMGAKVSALNAITAFANAGLQGLDRTGRAFKEDPGGVALKAGMYITAPSVLLWWANKDDERYKEIPRWQKDHFWIIPTDSWEKESAPGESMNLPEHMVRINEDGHREINKGVIYRIPKPQELGLLFGSVPERILEAFFTDHPKAFEDFGKTIAEMITPSVIPDVVTPIMEQGFNKSLFTGSKLVPAHLEDVLPQYQYTDYTSESAKLLSKLVTTVPFLRDAGPVNAPLASPIVLENYVRSWSGTMGQYALQLADRGLEIAGVTEAKARPASSLSDIPIIKAFVVRYPGGQTTSIEDFQKAWAENSKVINSIKLLGKQGDLDEAAALMTAPENQERLQSLAGTDAAIKNMGQFIQKVYSNPEMNPDEKRQIIDGTYYGMIEVAKAGLESFREFQKIVKEQKKQLKKESQAQEGTL